MSETGTTTNNGTPKEKPIYEEIVGQFRVAKTEAEMAAIGRKYNLTMTRLSQSENPYDVGNYHAIREAYKYYLKIIKHGSAAFQRSALPGSTARAYRPRRQRG